MYLTIRGIVLRINDYSDHDAMLTILTQKHGKLSVKARGLRRKNSPLTAACQLFVYGEYSIFEYKGQYSVNEAHVLELFQNLRNDLEKIALASYFAQVAEVLSQEDYPTPELQALLLNCLYGMSELGIHNEIVKSVFELRSACLSGYSPDLFGCHICGSQEPDRFDISAGQLECNRCRAAGSPGIRMPVNAAILEAMRYISFCEPKKIFSFRLGEQQLKQLSAITESFLSTQLERSFSALAYYKSLFEPDFYFEST